MATTKEFKKREATMVDDMFGEVVCDSCINYGGEDKCPKYDTGKIPFDIITDEAKCDFYEEKK